MSGNHPVIMKLVWPALEYLDSYEAALKRGWGADNTRPAESGREELAKIALDPQQFVASLVDREAKGAKITLPDGSQVPRLPGYRKWLWDDEFCGSIGFRWQNGTEQLPEYCLGHIGYSVVPWKRRNGCATEALRQLLPDAIDLGLKYVELTTDPENEASRKVILANGGFFIGEFIEPAQYDSVPGHRYRIVLKSDT
jgi:predicted acetyltransferase